jgi:hypothetical protein
VQSPGPTAILVGCGNIGSQLAPQLPLVGIRRIVLIDHDRVQHARNSRCCSLYSNKNLDGEHKVSVLARHIRALHPDCQVFELTKTLNLVGLAILWDFTPAVLLGCVDSLRTRYELAETSYVLNIPLVDLAINQSPDWVTARVRTSWTAFNGIDPLDIWGTETWSRLDDLHPCGQSRDDGRPVGSMISGIIAAALALMQVQQLLRKEHADIGWETRIDLSHEQSVLRCKLPESGSSPLDHANVILKPPPVVVAETIGELVRHAEARLGAGAEVILNRKIATELVCNRCLRRKQWPGPSAACECDSCGGHQHAESLLAVLSTNSPKEMMDAPVACLGADEDILLMTSGDGSRRMWLRYGPRATAEDCGQCGS